MGKPKFFSPIYGFKLFWTKVETYFVLYLFLGKLGGLKPKLFFFPIYDFKFFWAEGIAFLINNFFFEESLLGRIMDELGCGK